MAAAGDAIRNLLVKNEEILLKNETRTDALALSNVVGDACIEISESGKKSVYRTGLPFEPVDGLLYIVDDTVAMTDLAEGLKLLVYTAARVKKNARIKSTCSSIWKNSGADWKVIFHQRTLVVE